MSFVRRFKKHALVCATFGALVLGATSLFAPRAEALPGHPVLLCGPTFQWSCSGAGGPEILFIGTLCEARRFQRRTGLSCVSF